MIRSSSMKNWLLIFAIGCLLAISSNESANADGCWGSSRGGWGSGGSYGCRGGLFSNAPIRSLLSRVGSGVGNGIANLGDGIAGVFERRRFRSGSLGCRGGGWGSRGSYGSTGSTGGWGSNGGYGSSGGGYASNGSGWAQQAYVSGPAPGFASAPMYDTGAIVGNSNMINMPIVATNSNGCTGSVSAYVDPAAAYGSVGLPVAPVETSSQVLDYGYYGSQFGPIGIPTGATMIDGAMITGPMLDIQGEPNGVIESSPGSSDLPGGEGYYNGDTEPTPDAPPFGADEDDDSAYMPRGKAVLSLNVPKDARVYINDKLTQTEGIRRSYVSRNLIHGQEYRYRVKVVSDVAGNEIVKSRVVTMRGGQQNEVAFNFDPIVTRVVVSVPEDAKVIIDGKETSTAGAFRSFSTQKLKSGTWDDYSVEVSVVRDGKKVTRKEKFDLAAGEFRFFEFDFDKNTASSIAKN